MQRIIVLTVALAIVAAGAVYFVSRASNRPVVVGNQVQADDASVAKHVPHDWNLNKQ